MAGPRKERDGGSEEDLFEDLDQFFAPLEDSAWPEEDSTRDSAGEPGEAPGDVPEAEAEAEAEDVLAVEEELDALEIDIPAEEELLGGVQPTEGAAGPAAPGEEPEAVPPDEPASPEGPPADEPGVPVDEEPAGSTEGPPSEEGTDLFEPEPDELSLAELELAEEDWAAAADAEGVEAPAPTEGTVEEPVTVDDLSVPPPEYADLPGADTTAEAVPPPDDAEIASLDDLDEVMDEPAQTPAEEVAAGATTSEAAADHFAEGIPPEEIERELLADLGPTEDQTVQIDTEDAAAAAAAAGASAEPTPPTLGESEDLEGPTWQEEGAQPLEPEVEEAPPPAAQAPGGRNLVAAFASGILLAIAVIALLVIGKGPFAVFAALVILLGQAELYAVMRARGYRPATLMGLVAGAFMVAGAYLRGDAAVLFGLFLAVAASALWYMAGSPSTRRGSTGNIATTLLGVVYVPGLASFALLLLALPGDVGRNVFLTVIGLTILYDVAAYFVGSWFGSRPLAPTISPAKSWEGAIGGTLVLLLVSLAVVPAVDPFTSSTAVGLAILIAIAAPIGDLVESAFKRDLGVKDMGTILPGHGGILDRIDAILFTAPVAYYFLRIAFF